MVEGRRGWKWGCRLVVSGDFKFGLHSDVGN